MYTAAITYWVNVEVPTAVSCAAMDSTVCGAVIAEFSNVLQIN